MFRYGAFHDGPDPLASPADLRAAVDRLGEEVLRGSSVRDALRRLLREGVEGRRGLDALLRQVRDQQREKRRGSLDGTLRDVRRLLDTAVGQERAALLPDPSDEARLREAELDSVPADPARAVRQLKDYDWVSEDARATFEQLQQQLRRDVLDSRFRGMKQALQSTDAPSEAAALQRFKDMLADLNAMLRADERGEHTPADFERFMDRHGDFFPDAPQDLDELVDSLARRAAAAQRLLESLTSEQRDELAALAAQAMADLDLAAQMDQLGAALRSRRPDLDWNGRQRMAGGPPMAMGEATGALEDLADLAELESTLAQDYAGASLDDVDEEAVRRALGRRAADDLDELRRVERELVEQGFLRGHGARMQLSPKAVRRIGETALRRVLAGLEGARRGDHDVRDAGAAGERTGGTRAWRFGDEQPFDTVRTVSNAVRRAGLPAPGQGVRLDLEDFEVVETERRTRAAVCLLVDMSYSMVLRDTWTAAKRTALALHALVHGQYPQDAVQIVGFSATAAELTPEQLAGMDADTVQGTNLQHALQLAGRFLDRHRDAEPVVMVVTDGEPTAHLLPSGRPWFSWPPEPETLAATVAEVDRMTRRGAPLSIFLLEDDPRLERFVQGVARRNGGRVLAPDPARLGEYVVSDYLGRRGRGQGRRAS